MQIKIDDKCMELFKKLKFDKQHRYIVYKIEKEQILVEDVGERNETWAQMLHKLPKDQYRFAVFDIEFTTHDGIKSAKIFFLNWLPDGAKIKTKMLYATGKESFKKYLDLNSKQINVSSVDEMNEEQLISQFNK